MSDNLADLLSGIRAGQGTRQNKTLPAVRPVVPIPARTGSSPPITASASGSGIDMTLKGPKLFYSTDNLFVLSFPESAEAIVGTSVLVFPAIEKTP